MTKYTASFIAVLLALALVPFALIARSRALPGPLTRVAIIQDMAKQSKFRAQRENVMFADGRAARPRIAGTLAQEDLTVHAESSTDPVNPHVVNGAAGTFRITEQAQYDRIMLGQETVAGKTDFVATIPAPIPVTRDLLLRGQERFTIYCSPCHGASGYGDGMVARRVQELQVSTPEAVSADATTGWAPPANLNDDTRRLLRVGNIYNTITNGIRKMPRYDKQISVLDRWAIAGYVKALQQSQHTDLEALPENVKQEILNTLGSPNRGAPSSPIK